MFDANTNLKYTVTKKIGQIPVNAKTYLGHRFDLIVGVMAAQH